MPPSKDVMMGLANRFAVKVMPGDYNLGSWAKASGLEVKWDMPSYRAGDSWNHTWQFPGNTTYPTVKLERSATKDDTKKVKKWLDDTSKKFAMGSITIALHDAHGIEVFKWTCENAIPAKWSVVAFEAGTSKIAVETLEFSHNGFLDDAMTL